MIVSINTGAYVTEIVRGGIISIDRGQFEGAMSIGMSHFQTMLHVIIPQVMRNILPSVSNEFVVNIKDTSVSSGTICAGSEKILTNPRGCGIICANLRLLLIEARRLSVAYRL